MRDLDEKFPNPPLREVAYEVRFTPDLRIPYGIHRFQKEIRNQLPIIGRTADFVIGAQGVGTSPVESAWQFEDDEENLLVKVRANSLGIVTRKHRTFEVFYPHIERITSLFTGLYEVQSVNRVGFRYINDIRLGDSPRDELERFFVPAFNASRVSYENIVSTATNLRERRGDRFLTLRTQLSNGAQGDFHYLLDIDAYHEGQVKVELLPKVVNDLHKIAIKEFHANITDAFIEKLRKG